MPEEIGPAVDPASFRDPSGFVFRRGAALYRQVNCSYREEYDLLLQSGLYRALTERGLLVEHEELPGEAGLDARAYRVLVPSLVPFVSHPYEWSFGQLKAAALLTLTIQKLALEHGMSLKDASAYNVQWVGCRPLFIDTLSFERYAEGKPWVAYRQFCQHFLAPLALMARTDVRLGQFLRLYPDGIPLDLAARLLPGRTRLSPGLLLHIHLHSASQKRYADAKAPAARRSAAVSKTAMLGLLDSLEGAVRAQEWRPAGTTWADYYDHTNYTDAALDGKRQIVLEMLKRVSPSPHMVWDLGANTGYFSRAAASLGAYTVAWDVDPAAVERNYRLGARDGEERVLPLVTDLTNPSPDQGWALEERASLVRRGPADVVLALALLHHLAIGSNVPLAWVARFLARLAHWAIVEFVPKEDSQVQRMLATREDIFTDYDVAGFERAISCIWEIAASEPVPESRRVLYLLRRRESA